MKRGEFLENNDYRLSEIPFKKNENTVELLNLFADYIYINNIDYKYNKTYLKDKIDGFWGYVEGYNTKFGFCEKLLNEIKKEDFILYISINNINCNLEINIDETWKLEFNNLEKKPIFWNMEVCEKQKKHLIKRKGLYIRLNFSNNDGINFSEYIEAEDIKSFDTKKIVQYIRQFIERLVKIDEKNKEE